MNTIKNIVFLILVIISKQNFENNLWNEIFSQNIEYKEICGGKIVEFIKDIFRLDYKGSLLLSYFYNIKIKKDLKINSNLIKENIPKGIKEIRLSENNKIAKNILNIIKAKNVKNNKIFLRKLRNSIILTVNVKKIHLFQN